MTGYPKTKECTSDIPVAIAGAGTYRAAVWSLWTWAAKAD